MSTDYDIVISGGGVAGLTAAAAMGSAGFSVLLCDPTPPVIAQDQAGADLRTTAFLQPAQQLLDDIGLWPAGVDDAHDLQGGGVGQEAIPKPDLVQQLMRWLKEGGGAQVSPGLILRSDRGRGVA